MDLINESLRLGVHLSRRNGMSEEIYVRIKRGIRNAVVLGSLVWIHGAGK